MVWGGNESFWCSARGLSPFNPPLKARKSGSPLTIRGTATTKFFDVSDTPDFQIIAEQLKNKLVSLQAIFSLLTPAVGFISSIPDN